MSPNSNAAAGTPICSGFFARFVVLAPLRIDISLRVREVQAQVFEVVGFVTRTPKFH